MTFARLTARLQRSVFAFPLAILVGGLMLAISESAYYGADSQLSTLVTMSQARLELIKVIARVTDAEAGQRGYLLTGRPEYLGPYRFARADTMEGLETLRQLYADLKHPEAEERRARIAKAAMTKLGELQEVLRLYDEGHPDSAKALLLTDIGQEQMEDIRRNAHELLAQEDKQIDTGISNVFDTLLLNRIGVAAMTAISLLMITMFLRQGQQLARQRTEQQSLVKAERDRLEREVLRRTAELTELAQHLETAREDERARLARDLHDELGALLTAAKLDVARIRPKLPPESDLLPRLSHLTETLNAGIALKRRIIEDLRPSTLDQLGLTPALEILCKDFASQSALKVTTDLDEVELAPSGQLSVFRLVQEALNNIAKYAKASEVQVTLRQENEKVLVRVDDNGGGFDTEAARTTHGLVGMRYRVEAERGELRVQSSLGAGTVIEASLPRMVDDAQTSTEADASNVAPGPQALGTY